MLKTKQKKNFNSFSEIFKTKKETPHIKLTVLCFVTYMDCHDWSTKKIHQKIKEKKHHDLSSLLICFVGVFFIYCWVIRLM